MSDFPYVAEKNHIFFQNIGFLTVYITSLGQQWVGKVLIIVKGSAFLKRLFSEVKVSRNGPERRSGKRIIAGTAFRLEFLVGWYYDADATIAVPELY